jgi:rhamnosyltransferase
MSAVAPASANSLGGLRTFAVVVTFRCELDRLAVQFERLLSQVERIVWVDNGSGVDLQPWLDQWPADRVHPVWLAQNHGIGYGQNSGIEWALEHGATHVLLMDHDSLPGEDMVGTLMEALQARPDAAAVGPHYADPRRQAHRTPFFRVEGWSMRWLECHDRSQVWEVDHVIASGCLMPAAALRQVGLLQEDYFIDWVDVEWCLRARDRGFKIYGVCGADLEHRLGDQVAWVLGREVPLHAPWRHYYQSRNVVLMLRSTRVDFPNKVHHAVQQLKRLVVFSVFVPGRGKYFKMWMKGLLHGVLGRRGRLVGPGSV